MSGRDYDGSYRTDSEHRLVAKLRRDMLRAAGLCINGPVIQGKPGARAGVIHGLPNPVSGKCSRCEQIAKRSR